MRLIAVLDTSNWATYSSTRYTFPNESTIGYPADWTVHPAHVWTFEADGLDPMSTGQEAFVDPDGNVRASAWTVPRDPAEGLVWVDTMVGSWRNLEPWVQTYCERTGNTPCAPRCE